MALVGRQVSETEQEALTNTAVPRIATARLGQRLKRAASFESCRTQHVCYPTAAHTLFHDPQTTSSQKRGAPTSFAVLAMLRVCNALQMRHASHHEPFAGLIPLRTVVHRHIARPPEPLRFKRARLQQDASPN